MVRNLASSFALQRHVSGPGLRGFFSSPYSRISSSHPFSRYRYPHRHRHLIVFVFVFYIVNVIVMSVAWEAMLSRYERELSSFDR